MESNYLETIQDRPAGTLILSYSTMQDFDFIVRFCSEIGIWRINELAND